jgi:hypothetical protein
MNVGEYYRRPTKHMCVHDVFDYSFHLGMTVYAFHVH